MSSPRRRTDSKRGNNTSDQERELQRLAEFGRLSAGLIHDLCTPLTAAALTLDEAHHLQPSILVKRARRELRQIEFYVIAAKKQLEGESDKSSFSLTVAIHQVIMLLASRAQTFDVRLIANTIGSLRVYGEQAKFHQILANLINNGIESYIGVDCPSRTVTISVKRIKSDQVAITVEDKGKGIKPKDIARIFEPFYSTKKGINRGLGLGLATVKYYVEHDFAGSIDVRSSPSGGARFTVTIPLRPRS